jgi:hypothetical protein
MDVIQRRAGVGMTELLFCDFGGVSGVHDEGRDGMAEGMEATPGNVECVEDRPEAIFHDFVAR